MEIWLNTPDQQIELLQEVVIKRIVKTLVHMVKINHLLKIMWEVLKDKPRKVSVISKKLMQDYELGIMRLLCR